MSVGTKRPEGQNVQRDKMSTGTKCPEGQNIWGDKTSGRQNVLGDKTSGGTKRLETYVHIKNFRRDKSSETKHPFDLFSILYPQ
jgi:hypothetical protein